MAVTITVTEHPAPAVGPPGPAGPPGATGPTGPAGATGPGVPTGGTAGQALLKTSSVDYATAWTTLAAGGTTILNGAGPPADTLGSVGNYYEDTTNGVLYGPKVTPAGSVAGAILTEPFDNLSAWTNTSATIVAGRNGTAAQASGTTANAAWTIPSASESDTITVGFAWRFTDTGPALQRDIIRFCSDAGATVHCRLATVPQTSTAMLLGTGATIIGGVGNTTVRFTQNVWYYVEAQVKLHDTAGAVTVRVDGTQIINWTNVDTKNAGTKTVFDRIVLGSFGSGPLVGQYDDLYLKVGAGATFAGDPGAVTSGGVVWPITVRHIPGTIVQYGGTI